MSWIKLSDAFLTHMRHGRTTYETRSHHVCDTIAPHMRYDRETLVMMSSERET